MWLRNTKYDVSGMTPIFALRCIGPHHIADIGMNNTYRLKTIQSVTGKRATLLSLPVNGLRLRLYADENRKYGTGRILRSPTNIIGWKP